MGLERTMVSSKLSPENVEFLSDMERSLKPYSVSQSSLLDLCIRIVRQLHRQGKVNLQPAALQELLGTEGRPGTTERRKP
jgi:hypothetical protein